MKEERSVRVARVAAAMDQFGRTLWNRVSFPIFILIVIAAMYTVKTTRGYDRWEVSRENLISARNNLDNNVVLLESVLEWERASGYSEEWVKAREDRIIELKKEVEDMNSFSLKLDEMSFYQRVHFSEEKAQQLRIIRTGWSRKLRETVVGSAELIDELRGRLFPSAPPTPTAP